MLGELVVSTRVLGTTKIMHLNHTGCGFTTFTDDELNAKLTALTGDASPAPMRFFSYKDPEENTREQMKKVRSHPCAQGAALGIARSELYPTLSGVALSGVDRGEVPLGSRFHRYTDTGVQVSLDLNYTIFDFGARRGRIDAERALVVLAANKELRAIIPF